MSEYVANVLLGVYRPSGGFIVAYSYQNDPVANAEFPVRIHPGEMLPAWVHEDDIKALLDRGMITLRVPPAPP